MYAHQIIDQYEKYIKEYDFSDDKNQIINEFIKKLRSVIKFYIGDARWLDDNIKVKNEDSIRRFKKYIKLPYNKCWFEFDISNQNFVTKEEYKKILSVSLPVKYNVPDKIGIYAYLPKPKSNFIAFNLIAHRKDKKKWLSPLLTGFVDLDNFKIYPGYFIKALTKEQRNHLFGESNIDIQATQIETITKTFYDLAQALILLNCKNIITKEVSPSKKLNQKRSKNNKCPIFTYHILKICSNKKNIKSMNNKEITRTNRIHFCRGHFKQRKTGIYWWQPHVRGRNKQGIVIKDYKI